MQEDIVRIVEELITSGKGDVERLQHILNLLKNGEEVSFLDQKYIETLTSNEPSETATQDIHTNDFSDLEKHADNVSDLETSPSNNSEDSSMPSMVKKSMPTKKYAAVGIAIAIVLFAYIGLDVYAVNTLQFRPHSGQQVIISDTELGIHSDACNPSYFPATFSKYEIVAFYNSEEIEKATISGTTISPKTASTLDGVFALNKDTISKFAKNNVTFDPTQAHITTTIYAPIFGFIPYSINKSYAAEEFQKVLRNGPPGSYSC